MPADPPIYGLLAEFDSPEAVLAAARRARAEGYRRMDAYTPFSVEGLSEAVGFRFNLLPWLALLAGFGGAGGGFFMEWYGMAVSYPLNIGGRPLNSWQSFIPVTFELGVLAASLTALFGMLALCGLPKPYHPVFNAPNFDLMTRDKFFLCIEAADPKFEERQTWQFLSQLQARRVTEVEHWKM